MKWIKAKKQMPERNEVNSYQEKFFVRRVWESWGNVHAERWSFDIDKLKEVMRLYPFHAYEWLQEIPELLDGSKILNDLDYHTHLSNLIKIIETLGPEHGHSLNPEFKKYLEDAKKLI